MYVLGKMGKTIFYQRTSWTNSVCLENGNSTFDHADIYGDYSTEAEFGKAFVESGIAREDIQLISKCGIQLVGEARNNKLKHYNYAKEYIIWSVENSLQNFKTDYLDTLLLHRPSPLMQPDEIAEAISELKESGKIINFGVSNFTPSQVDLIADKIPVSINQIEFSLTHYAAMQNGSLDQMLQKQIQPMCWSPLGNVFKNETPQSFRIRKILNILSKNMQFLMMCFYWLGF